MVRRIELLLGVGTVLAAAAAIVATIFVPIATMSLSVGDDAPIIRHVYARDNGLVPMLAVTAITAVLAVCVLLGAYVHSHRGSTFARAIMLAAVLAYLALVPASVRQGAFAVYPALVALACALVALIPSRQRPAPVTPLQQR
jgi:hypothetical protein